MTILHPNGNDKYIIKCWLTDVRPKALRANTATRSASTFLHGNHILFFEKMLCGFISPTQGLSLHAKPSNLHAATYIIASLGLQDAFSLKLTASQYDGSPKLCVNDEILNRHATFNVLGPLGLMAWRASQKL